MQVTSAKAGLIEAIPNIVSLHQLHKMSNLTLAEYFRKSYGGDAHKYKLAQRNFSESLAGYSLLTYILQVKDRHNGNILLDNEGHIVHIDFGAYISLIHLRYSMPTQYFALLPKWCTH